MWQADRAACPRPGEATHLQLALGEDDAADLVLVRGAKHFLQVLVLREDALGHVREDGRRLHHLVQVLLTARMHRFAIDTTALCCL